MFSVSHEQRNPRWQPTSRDRACLAIVAAAGTCGALFYSTGIFQLSNFKFDLSKCQCKSALSDTKQRDEKIGPMNRNRIQILNSFLEHRIERSREYHKTGIPHSTRLH
ncbi:hypothetical protein TSAR_010545 [Trichomalopsis sarcophagae]|uniref:Uncharacterized protein n=1 Tax=Trichomalopsis sarcophagae TaxID=543379 RepID=A0A232F5X3_9HYME|nr:hypothetical protein TSAR_010545 [Trichomalopsis sarcophagae]